MQCFFLHIVTSCLYVDVDCQTAVGDVLCVVQHVFSFTFNEKLEIRYSMANILKHTLHFFLYFPFCAEFNFHNFYWHMHTTVIRSTVIFLKNTKFLHVSDLTDDGPVRSKPCSWLVFFKKYYCTPNDNCAHLLLKITEISNIISKHDLWDSCYSTLSLIVQS
jgi:hypothetical protein